MLNALKERIYSAFFRKKHRNEPNNFTRKRVFSIERLILFQLNIANKSLTIELNRFFKRIDHNKEIKSYSKQSYSEARMKMKHGAYIELNEELIKGFYKDDDYEKYKGYRLIVIDGTKIQMPNRASIVEEFGYAENQVKKIIPMAMSSTAYDILNHMVVDTCLENYRIDERTLADRHLDKIRELTPGLKDIILMDRGYPSLYLFAKMMSLGFDFIVRCSDTSFIKEVRKFAQSKETDKIIEIDLTEEQRKNRALKDKLEGKAGRLRMRLVKIKLTSGVTEYIITSLLNKTTFTREDVKELYHLRWGEETYFNFLKNVLEIENFSGRTPETIRQDYYAKVLSSNIGSLMIEEAQEELDEETSKNDKLKYNHYKINRAVATGLMKDELIEMLIAPEKESEYRHKTLIKTIKRYTIPEIPNRHYIRLPKLLSNFFLKKRKVI